jgi:hypothetical protein
VVVVLVCVGVAAGTRPVSELSGPTTPDELCAPNERRTETSNPENDLAAWEVAGGLLKDHAEGTDCKSSESPPAAGAPRVARPHGSSRQQQRKTMAAVARRLMALLGLPAHANAAPTVASESACSSVKEARLLLGCLRTTMERFLGADGLASVEAYVQACGASLPVRITPGGSVVLPGADRRGRQGSSAVLAAFDRACAILPTFAPRELATVVVPTVHALLQWEHAAVVAAV